MPAGSLDTADPARWRAGRIVALVAIASIVALWGYVLYLAVGPGRQDPPDRLDDPAFAAAAEVRCQAALDAVAALPPAQSATSPAERAEVIDEATAIFAGMVDDLEALGPGGDDGRLVDRWLADWRTYLEDRREHAAVLRTGQDRRFQVTARNNEQITNFIDAFAADNDMPACGSPLDV